MKYAVTDNLDVIAAYYYYIQNSFFGTAAGTAPCSRQRALAMRRYVQCDLRRYRLKFAPKWDVYAGFMFSQVNGGFANGYLQRNDIDPTVGLRFRF